jgi:hypothetical protein
MSLSFCLLPIHNRGKNKEFIDFDDERQQEKKEKDDTEKRRQTNGHRRKVTSENLRRTKLKKTTLEYPDRQIHPFRDIMRDMKMSSS